jgi:hypothetical protein
MSAVAQARIDASEQAQEVAYIAVPVRAAECTAELAVKPPVLQAAACMKPGHDLPLECVARCHHHGSALRPDSASADYRHGSGPHPDCALPAAAAQVQACHPLSPFPAQAALPEHRSRELWRYRHW